MTLVYIEFCIEFVKNTFVISTKINEIDFIIYNDAIDSYIFTIQY